MADIDMGHSTACTVYTQYVENWHTEVQSSLRNKKGDGLGVALDRLVTAARQVTPEVRAWGVNGETVAGQAAGIKALIHRVGEAGCDGMTINWPDWVRHSQEPSDQTKVE